MNRFLRAFLSGAPLPPRKPRRPRGVTVVRQSAPGRPRTQPPRQVQTGGAGSTNIQATGSVSIGGVCDAVMNGVRIAGYAPSIQFNGKQLTVNGVELGEVAPGSHVRVNGSAIFIDGVMVHVE